MSHCSHFIIFTSCEFVSHLRTALSSQSHSILAVRCQHLRQEWELTLLILLCVCVYIHIYTYACLDIGGLSQLCKLGHRRRVEDCHFVCVWESVLPVNTINVTPSRGAEQLPVCSSLQRDGRSRCYSPVSTPSPLPFPFRRTELTRCSGLYLQPILCLDCTSSQIRLTNGKNTCLLPHKTNRGKPVNLQWAVSR